MVLELNESNFDKETAKGNVVVDCWANWCGPCKVFGPIFERTSKGFEGKVKFAKLDVDHNLAIAQRFEIMSIPTTLFMKDGKVIEEYIGVMDEKMFTEKLKKLYK